MISVTDITEIKTAEGKLYVLAIEDCFDNSILGLSIADNMKVELWDTLTSAIISFPALRGAIVHLDTWRVLVNDENKLVGYWHLTPMYMDFYNKMKNGIIIDGEIDINMIPMLIPGKYDLYFIGICLTKEYQKTQTMRLILDSMFESFKNMAHDKIFINDMCTLAYTKKGSSLSKGMGFKIYKDLETHGTIYSCGINDFFSKSYTRNYKDLKELYNYKNTK